MWVRLHLRGVVALIVLAGLVAAPFAYPMLLRVAARGFAGSITYNETNGGTNRGDVLVGVTGRGTFSGQLRSVSAVAAYVAEAIKGVPYTALAKGGTFAVRYDIDAKNNYLGTLVAKFVSKGLGSVCLTYSLEHGTFKSGDQFIPATGSVKITGGTGQAAQLQGGARFTQTDVAGDTVEKFLAKGLVDLKVGPSKPMSKACRVVAKP
jgi:hypothetical protein